MNIGIEKAIKLTRKGKYQAALHLYNEILEREPSSLEARGHRAWLLRSIGSYEKALEDYIFIVKHVSGDEEALFRLGEMYILLGKK